MFNIFKEKFYYEVKFKSNHKSLEDCFFIVKTINKESAFKKAMKMLIDNHCVWYSSYSLDKISLVNEKVKGV